MACYSIVARASLENIASVWVPELRKLEGSAEIVLVGTKKDLAISTPNAVTEIEASEKAKEISAYDSIQCSALLCQGATRQESNVDRAFKTAIACGIGKMRNKERLCCVML